VLLVVTALPCPVTVHYRLFSMSCGWLLKPKVEEQEWSPVQARAQMQVEMRA